MERRLFFCTLIIFVLLNNLHTQITPEDSTKLAYLKAQGIEHAMAGEFESAETSFLEMLEIDSTSERAINNLGLVYKRMARYNDALKVYKTASDLVIAEYGPDFKNLASIYLNIGNIYNIKQDFELALQYFNYAERIVHINSLTDRNATSVYNSIGNFYYHRKLWRIALDYYMKGVKVKKQYKAGGLDISYANVASTYENLDILDSAKHYYLLSIEDKIEQFNDSSSHFLISVYDNYGVLLKKLEMYDESIEKLNKALELAKLNYLGKHPVTAECYRYLGSWYLSMDQPDLALSNFHKAIITVVYDFDNEDLYSNPSLESEILSEVVLLDALRGKADALRYLYDSTQNTDILISALEALEKSNLLTEKMRSTYQGQESKLIITESSHEGYSKAINTAFDLYQLTGQDEYANKAFIFAEKSKSSVLLASLQEVENKKNLGIPGSMQAFEEDLKSQMEEIKKKLYEEKQREQLDSSKLGKWQGKLITLSQQLDSLNAEIREDYPEYASKYNNEVIDLEGVKLGLKKDQVLLEYAFTDDFMFLFLFDRDNHFISRIPFDPGFNEDIGILSQFLRDNDFANNTFDDYEAYTNAAYSLYNSLIGPVEDKITGKKLIIIPDGELGYIPFEALLTAEPDAGGMDYRSLQYLIYKYSTNYSYSATLLFSETAEKGQSERQLLAFAPTYEHMGEIKDDKFPAYRDFSNYLVPLRFISEEIENISNILDCDRYENYEATEEVFRQEAPNYDILHLAMHTLINDENPMYSQLVFTLNNDTLENNDGLLNTYEIFNIHLSARMVVLSACNTGYGQLRKGEGIMSLARGFIYAGVPSIIMTLWAVEDQSGSILMSKFYENLVDGQDIDAALRESKLQYLQNADQLGAHPYLWSGYVSIGSTQPLVPTSNRIIYLLSFGLVAIVLVFVSIRMLNKRKRA